MRAGDKPPKRLPDFVKDKSVAKIEKAAEKVTAQAPAAAAAVASTTKIEKVPAQVGWAKLEAKLEKEA